MRNMPFEIGKKAATRDVYGKALLELGRLHPDVVALDADLAGSTRSGDRKVGNPFQTKQGSRPSCPDQEGRKGSEEGVDRKSTPLNSSHSV